MPGATPVTIPVAGLATAIVISLLLQLPPGDVLLIANDGPTHTLSGPVITAGSGLIVTIVVATQPVTGTV